MGGVAGKKNLGVRNICAGEGVILSTTGDAQRVGDEVGI
jgi:hypothetical protein